MNKLSEAIRKSGGRWCSGQGDQREVPVRLRHQSRWAALLLFSPWLISIFLSWPIIYSQPFSVIGLLPGLAVAAHIVLYLSFNLASNHRPFQEEHLFPALGAANWITLLRAAAIVAMASILPIALHSKPRVFEPDTLAWASGIIYLGISLFDLLDGYVARKQKRETVLGKQLDTATDASGLLAASLLAVTLGRLPVIYLLVGLAYYPFILATWLRRRRALPVVALQSRPYARIIAGFQMGLVAMALMPIFKPSFTYLAAYIFMTPLLIGFVRDWLVVSCRIKTDGNQQSRLDLWLRSLVITPLPLALRLIIFSGGITTLVGSGFLHTHLFYQIIHSLCCLLAAIGFMGRSSALLLVLLLAGNQSPFGMTVLSITLFSGAAALMLSGTGVLSLWRPEDTILYRRNKKSSGTPCEAI